MPFSKCLQAKIYSNLNVYFDPQGCETLPNCLPNYFLVFLSFDVYLIVILDVARGYLWLFTSYINIKIGKNSCLMLD